MSALHYALHRHVKKSWRRNGFMLIEALIALLILSFMSMGLVAGYSYYMRLQNGVNERLQALIHASNAVGKIQVQKKQYHYPLIMD